MRKAFHLLGLMCLFALQFIGTPLAGWVSASTDELASEAGEPRHIVVDEFLGGFAGGVLLVEFNASENSEIRLDLTAYCSGTHTVKLKVTGATQGILFQAEGDRYNQTVEINRKDSYNVTVSKSPFYSDVIIRGTIDVIDIEEAPTSTPSPTSESLTPSVNPNPNPTASPAVPEFSPFVTVPLLMLATLIALSYRKKRNANS